MDKREFFGNGEIKRIKEILESLKARHIFLVTGKESYQKSKAKQSLEPILKNYEVTHFTEFSSNPQVEDILKGLKSFKKEIDVVITIGGGSPMDTAKAINILASQKGDPILFIKGEKRIENTPRPLIAVPTTTGSGSEVTQFSVVYIGEKKYSLEHPYMVPAYAIVDPELSLSMPVKTAASTTLDAFTQATESYWSVNSTDESRALAKQAIELILKHARDSVHRPSLDFRGKIAKAAFLAGKAINITRTTVCHALSYTMTSSYGVPHGQAVVISLAYAFEYNFNISAKDCIDKRGAAFVKSRMKELLSILGAKDVADAKATIIKLIDDLKMASSVRQLGFTKEHLDKIVKDVNLERLQNNPRKFENSESLYKLLPIN